jgi:hypothetical protein
MAFVAPVQKEVAVQRPNEKKQYLVGFEPQQFQVIAQLPAGAINTNVAYPQQEKQQMNPLQNSQNNNVTNNDVKNDIHVVTPVNESQYAVASPIDEK